MDDRTTLMSAKALDSGYQVLWYTIRNVLGQGGFGITYLAHDNNLDREVAIKEYLPTSFAFRHQDYSVKPITADHGENFAWGLNNFLKEAQTLARFSHDNIVRVHSVFELNSTAYMVMEYEQGDSLHSLFKQGIQVKQSFLEQVFFPIFDGLERIHELGFIHRDIKPGNIYVRANRTPVLLDFGSARQTAQQNTGEITTLVSQGYTPIEQYSPNYGDQGPWTDIYSLAATLYQGVTGTKPEESLSRSACRMRSKPDPVVRLTTEEYPSYQQAFLDAVLAGLALEPEMRPQNFSDWRHQFDQKTRPHFGQAGNGQPGGTPQTQLDDRTRLQPRASQQSAVTQSAIVENSMPLDSVAAGGIDDELDWSESMAQDPVRSPSMRGGASNSTENVRPDTSIDSKQASTSSQSTRRGKGKSRSSRMGIVLASVLGLVGLGIAGYVLLGEFESKESEINAATLASLPAPDAPIIVTAPKERVLNQLQDMQALATLFTQAHTLKSEDTELIDGVNSLTEELVDAAKQWNSNAHPVLSEKLLQISQNLPAELHAHDRIQNIVQSPDQLSNPSLVLDLLQAGQYLQPAGESVLDKINSLTIEDAGTVRTSKDWVSMMEELKAETVNSIKAGDFSQAGLHVEAALMLDPDDSQIKLLMSHLTLSQ